MKLPTICRDSNAYRLGRPAGTSGRRTARPRRPAFGGVERRPRSRRGPRPRGPRPARTAADELGRDLARTRALRDADVDRLSPRPDAAGARTAARSPEPHRPRVVRTGRGRGHDDIDRRRRSGRRASRGAGHRGIAGDGDAAPELLAMRPRWLASIPRTCRRSIMPCGSDPSAGAIRHGRRRPPGSSPRQPPICAAMTSPVRRRGCVPRRLPRVARAPPTHRTPPRDRRRARSSRG